MKALSKDNILSTHLQFITDALFLFSFIIKCLSQFWWIRVINESMVFHKNNFFKKCTFFFNYAKEYSELATIRGLCWIIYSQKIYFDNMDDSNLFYCFSFVRKNKREVIDITIKQLFMLCTLWKSSAYFCKGVESNLWVNLFSRKII